LLEFAAFGREHQNDQLLGAFRLKGRSLARFLPAARIENAACAIVPQPCYTTFLGLVHASVGPNRALSDREKGVSQFGRESIELGGAFRCRWNFFSFSNEPVTV